MKQEKLIPVLFRMTRDQIKWIKKISKGADVSESSVVRETIQEAIFYSAVNESSSNRARGLKVK